MNLRTRTLVVMGLTLAAGEAMFFGIAWAIVRGGGSRYLLPALLAVFSVGFLVTINLLLNKLIFSRMALLGERVKRIAETGDATVSLAIPGRDELSQLSEATANMVGRLGEVQSQLSLATEQATAANEAKSHFLANISHEIRTPMTAILGYADMLLEESDRGLDAKRRRQVLDTIRRNGGHLLAIINDVLDVSKIEAGRMTVERLSCSLQQVVADAVALTRPWAVEKKLPLAVEYAQKMPLTVRTDPTRLRQILVNLISNAIKFTTKGGVRVIVRVDDASKVNPKAHIEVVDTGIGLSEQQMKKLFKPFSQADASTTRKYGGTGLGLVISKHLAEALGGDITVRSMVGEGSSFLVSLETGSLTGVPMVALATDDPSTPPAALPSGRFRGRVLLAEDGLDNQDIIQYFLERLGLTVEVVDNGRLAVERAEAAEQDGLRFDLIFMDVQMPEMDGLSATRYLRQGGYRGPIVALTAHSMAGDRQRCLDAGCSDYASKPIDHVQFLSVIAKHLPAAVEDHDPSVTLTPVAAATATAPTPPVVEKKPDFADLVNQFMQRLSAQIGQIEELLVAENLDQIRKIAHQIKGSAGMFGYMNVTDAAAALDKELKGGREPAKVRELSGQLAALSREMITQHAAVRADVVHESTAVQPVSGNGS